MVLSLIFRKRPISALNIATAAAYGIPNIRYGPRWDRRELLKNYRVNTTFTQ